MRNLLTMVMVFALAIGALYVSVQKASAASVFAKNAKKYNWDMKWGKNSQCRIRLFMVGTWRYQCDVEKLQKLSKW